MREGAEGGAGGEGGSHSYGGVANGMDWRPRRWFTTGWTARERFWVDSKCYLCPNSKNSFLFLWILIVLLIFIISFDFSISEILIFLSTP